MDEALASALPAEAPDAAEKAHGPSALYRGGIWKAALACTRRLPLPVAMAAAKSAGQLYRLANSRRGQIVFNNLLPVFAGDKARARAATTRLFTRFGAKIVDLFRYETGLPTLPRFTELSHWENFAAPFQRGGVLMVTPHLGNWEIGATLMVDKGVKFFAVTQAEPGANFTQMRAQARARWGVETIVVGQDAFAFVEIIRRLQEGASVALLIDRPAPQSAVEVQLFGRPFHASIAPAELARASGCAVVGGYIVEENGGYAARFFPELPYDRRALGHREGRRDFTQQLLAAFEPAIRQYADQWYHFVPIWPK